MAEKRTPMSVRVPPDMTRRLDKLVPKVARDPAVATFGLVTRSAVVKLALLRGLDALEQEYK